MITAAALVDALVTEPVEVAASNGAMRDRYDTAYYSECGGYAQYVLFHGRKLEEPRLADRARFPEWSLARRAGSAAARSLRARLGVGSCRR